MHNTVTEQIRLEVEKAMKAQGVGARRFEDIHGLPKWTLRGLLDPNRHQAPSVDRADEICRALGIELVIGERRGGYPGEVAELAAKAKIARSMLGPPDLQHHDPDTFAKLPVYDVLLAAGSGHHNDTEEIVAQLAFRKDWLKGIGVSPGSAVIARARGISMLPTIHDGDMVLVDRAQASPPLRPREPNDQRAAKIFALHHSEGARIKRLELAAPGTLALLSDNPECPPEFHPAASLSIIGRVMWWGHTARN